MNLNSCVQKEMENISSNSGHFLLDCECLPIATHISKFSICNFVFVFFVAALLILSQFKKSKWRKEEEEEEKNVQNKTKQTCFCTSARVHEC